LTSAPTPSPYGVPTNTTPTGPRKRFSLGRKGWIAVGGVGIFAVGLTIGASGASNSSEIDSQAASISKLESELDDRDDTIDSLRSEQNALEDTIDDNETTIAALEEEPTEAEPVEAETVVEAPTPEPEPAVEPAPANPPTTLTLSQQNAVRQGESYLDYSGFSRSGLIDQLEYEGYSIADAEFAVDTIAPDWNAEAAESAQSYIDYSSFSRQGLLDQLLYEGFTPEQANFGVGAVGY
jgi:hypothetical protein